MFITGISVVNLEVKCLYKSDSLDFVCRDSCIHKTSQTFQVRDLVSMIIPLRDVNTVEKADGAGNTQGNAMVVTTRGKVQ